MAKRKYTAHDYLNGVSEFITYLSVNELTLEEILRHLVLVVLTPLNAESILIRQLNSQNKVVLVKTWGISLEDLERHPASYSLNDKYPTTDTLRYRRTTWINTLPDWGDDYPLLKELQYYTGAKSYICFPIDRGGIPVATLGIFCRDAIPSDAEIEAFLMAVGSVFSIYMFRRVSRKDGEMKVKRKQSPLHLESIDTELSERQQVILRLISENRTNIVIGGLLGYSESTIRQETIKIFAKLGCTGRKEATQIYRDQSAKLKKQQI